jgi:hypothetical protein
LRRAVRVLLQVAKFIESLGEVFVETKFDGDRVIIHFHKGQLQVDGSVPVLFSTYFSCFSSILLVLDPQWKQLDGPL